MRRGRPRRGARPWRRRGREFSGPYSERLGRLGVEIERVREQRQVDRFAVARLDVDLAWWQRATDADLARRVVRQADVRHGRFDATADGAVIQRQAQPRLGLILVREAVQA